MQGSASPAVGRIGGENKLEQSATVLPFLQICTGHGSQSSSKLKWARKSSSLYLLSSPPFAV